MRIKLLYYPISVAQIIVLAYLTRRNKKLLMLTQFLAFEKTKSKSLLKKYVVHWKHNDDCLNLDLNLQWKMTWLFSSVWYVVVHYQIMPQFRASSNVTGWLTIHPSLLTKDKSYFQKSLSSKSKQVKVKKQIGMSENLK